ncbi:MAG: T9SS type A sorting domain-containing protein [Bacteroidia bacterium]
MKKHLLIFASVLFSTYFFGQSIPNGGFESWVISTYENPQFYQTSNYEHNSSSTTPVNATKTTDAYHGAFALKLTTAVTSPTTPPAFAYFANGNPGGPNPAGGIAYTQKPSGLRFHYKSNIIGTDTAIFICIFKKLNVNIGTYFYKFTTSQTNYTLFNPTFNPALPVFPDSVIIACASSNAFINGGYNVGNSMQIDSLAFTGVAFQPVNLNGDFEQWTSLSDYKLNGWNTGSASQSTDVYSGSYALELQTTPPAFGDNQVQVGRAMTGTPTQSNTLGGYPYTGTIDTLFLYYKYFPANPVDSARVSLTFKKNFVGLPGFQVLLPQAFSYTLKKIPINNAIAPDTMILFLESSKWPVQNSYVGADFKIDNMYLKSQKLPISNFNAPLSGCVGQPVSLTDNSFNMANAWNWIMPGGSPSSSILQNPTVTYATPGTKTITMNANNQFGTGGLISKTITVYALPSVGATSSSNCGGVVVTLTATGASSYLWSNAQTTSSITVSPTVSTNYTVTGTLNGCQNSAVGSINIPVIPTASICMVTVDSLSQYNEIYWNKNLYPMMDSMIVYRQTSTNVYKRIASVSKNSTLSMLVDTMRSIGPANGDPKISTYRYKIQIRDTCGYYGPMSLWHNTVYFTNNNGTFFWVNSYSIEGSPIPTNPVLTYSLMVCINPSISSVYLPLGTTAGNQNSLTDPNYSTYLNTADWRVEGNLGYECDPSLRTTNTLSKATKSRSNIGNNRLIGIKENSLLSAIKVYPNPANSTLNFEIASQREDLKNLEFTITNVLGSVVYNGKMDGKKATIDVSTFAKGVYSLNVNSQAGKVAYKVIVN